MTAPDQPPAPKRRGCRGAHPDGQSGLTPRRAKHEGTVWYDTRRHEKALHQRSIGDVVFEGEHRRVSDKGEDQVSSMLARLRVEIERHCLPAKDAGRLTVAAYLET